MVEHHLSADPRLKIALPITIEWYGEEKQFFRIKTFTDNISLGGICFMLTAKEFHPSLELSREVRILVNQGRITTSAQIRHITITEEGLYRIGIALSEPIFEWLSRYKRCNPELLRNVIPTTLGQPERRKR